MLTVYTVSYNEEFHIQHMIDYYRSRFPDCRIVVHDNISTDRTVEIAMANGCEVVPFDTHGKFSDDRHIQIKNSCWKDAGTDWILTCDMDELLNITQDELQAEEARGTTLIRSEGYNMINMEDNCDLGSITYGARAVQYDKPYLFNKRLIKEINYTHGCHGCHPIGTIKKSDRAYKAYHLKFINVNLALKRYKSYGERLSPENLKNGWGGHYLYTEQQIREEFDYVRSLAVKIEG